MKFYHGDNLVPADSKADCLKISSKATPYLKEKVLQEIETKEPKGREIICDFHFYIHRPKIFSNLSFLGLIIYALRVRPGDFKLWNIRFDSESTKNVLKYIVSLKIVV